MPKYAGRILQNSYVSREHGGILFNHWSIVAGSRVQQLGQLAEAGEAPIRLFGDEPMSRI